MGYDSNYLGRGGSAGGGGGGGSRGSSRAGSANIPRGNSSGAIQIINDTGETNDDYTDSDDGADIPTLDAGQSKS
jgi:hypothetical protein